MFSRILSGKKKEATTSSSPNNPTLSLSTRDSVNTRRTPGADKQAEGPRALFFRSNSSTLPSSGPSTPGTAAPRLGTTRSASPPSTSVDSSTRGAGVFEADNRLLSMPKQLTEKKSSEPNVLKSARSEKMQKSNSQPVLTTRRSADLHRSGSNRNRPRAANDERGFLDRAFENAASVVIDEADRTNSGDSLASVVEGSEAGI